jgi:Fic family protein
MFTPSYTLSMRLINSLSQIERFYGQIEALNIPQKLELNLERDNMIQSSYASNKIEGNPLTLPEVTNLILGDRIPTNRDEKEVTNYFEILKHITKYKDRAFALDLITDFHKLLMTGVDETAGMIRNDKVVVGKFKKEKEGSISIKVKHEPPVHTRSEITEKLKDLITWANGVSDMPAPMVAGIFHHQFVYIHPFEDGNGRVCRLLSSLLFIKRNYFINKYFILDDYYDIDRSQYSDMLHSADQGDKTKWLEYFSDGVRYSLQSALFKAKHAMRTLSFDERPTTREKEVLALMTEMKEITSSDVSSKFQVSRQQAFNLLKALVDKGLINRHGTTKASYYSIE